MTRRGAVRPGALALAAGLVLATGCATTPRGAPQEDWMDYLDTVKTLEAGGPALEPGSEAERRAIERFQAAISDFKAPDFGQRIGAAYAENAFFNDTLKTLDGSAAIREYFETTAEALDEGSVDFLDVVSDRGNHYFRWAMTLRSPRLAGGKPVRSVGMSHVRFDADGRVVLHQDFWDSTGGLFEHLPALGWMLRRVKGRL